ncbi:MAG: MFS transporter [Oscillospiraceae bacterium]|nr:MFS transporter [Oscillospiraceae bacterium]
MQKLSDKKQINRISVLFALTYMVSYISRINYGAVLSEMEAATQMQKTLLSVAVTGSFITYGVGQVVTGICGDWFSPKKLIAFGFVLTALMNGIIPLCRTPMQMMLVWSVNGFAQAFMWPPMVKMMTALLSDDDYKKVTTRVIWGSSAGTIVVYLLSPALIWLGGWKAVFVFAALCAAVMLLVWLKKAPEVTVISKKQLQEQPTVKFNLFRPAMLLIMLMVICQGMLRDGVTTWMPSYITDNYNLGSQISILTGVVLPLFSILCTQLGTRLYRKKLKNPLTCAALLFGVGMAASLVLVVLGNISPVVSVLGMAMLTGAMHGVNLMLICMLPAYFQKTGKVSTVSGVLNACTYIGSALSTYMIAYLVEKFGWQLNLQLWLVVTAVGTLVCLLLQRPWKNINQELS